MGINIDFQLAEGLKFMEKRLIKVPRRKIILVSFSFGLVSGLLYYYVAQIPLILVIFLMSAGMFLYNILYFTYNNLINLKNKIYAKIKTGGFMKKIIVVFLILILSFLIWLFIPVKNKTFTMHDCMDYGACKEGLEIIINNQPVTITKNYCLSSQKRWIEEYNVCLIR
mgnify:CR=1 FL=1